MFANRAFYLITLIICSTFWSIASQQGLVVVPVADLVGHPMHTAITYHSYTNLLWSPVHTIKDCPRLHQALFNEVVEVLEYNGLEAHISVPNAYHQKHTLQPKQTEYWTLACNILPLSEIAKKDSGCIPKPIHHTRATDQSKEIVVLLEPLHDPVTSQTYSIGTRFIVHKKNSETIYVYAYNHLIKKTVLITIPHDKAIISKAHNTEESIKLFLSILTRWLSSQTNVVPYVWGGCSLTTTLPTNTFSTEAVQNKNDIITNYNRPHETAIKTGFDCSSLILRAAQAAGMPYFFKNTSTAQYKLKTLTSHEKPENGDLIWTNGHIMIIADIENNTIIEAGSYGNGYGKIHALPIEKIFKNITTIDELKDACINKKRLQRLNAHGAVSTHYVDCKILKIRSLWNAKK